MVYSVDEEDQGGYALLRRQTSHQAEAAESDDYD